MRLRYPVECYLALVNEGWVAVYEASLGVGLRFPLFDFGQDFLQTFYISPSQIHPNGWLLLIVFSILCTQKRVIVSPQLFSCF